MSYKFKILGLDCANCAASLEREIEKIDGVQKVQINFLMQKMEIEYDETKKEEIMKKLKKAVKREDATMEEI